MNEFRRLAAKIDQHMQQLAAQGVSETHAIINRMMGYGPVAPLGWEHITFNGDYIWPTEPLEYGFRPLRDPRSAFLDAA